MPRSPFSLKSAHLLMWSSPLLLVILVITLTSTSAPRAPEASSRPPSSTSPVTTLVPTTTTSYATKPSTKVIEAAKTNVTTTLVVRILSPVTTSSVVKNYSNATTSSVARVAPISSANALSGELSGNLEPGFESVDVPLRGPGSWTLSVSASSVQTLTCDGATTSVANQVVVGSSQGCQLEISSTSTQASLTWQLTPNS